MSQSRVAVGERIARARRRRGLSQAVLSGLIDRSESWLSQVERGRRRVDSYSVLNRLADVLHVDIEELTGPMSAAELSANPVQAAASAWRLSHVIGGRKHPGGSSQPRDVRGSRAGKSDAEF